MTDLVNHLHKRAESYRLGGPSSEHTAVMLEEAASRISQQDAELERLRREVEEARNAEWKAAISAVQYMNANWWQDCRSDVERQALEKAAQSIIDELRRVGPTEYLDVQWKNAEDAVAAEAKAAEARKAAFIEVAEMASLSSSPSVYAFAAMIRAKSEETGR